MKSNLKKLIVSMLIAAMLFACIGTIPAFAAEAVTIDFEDAETFEKALNDGKDLVGKTVRFVVNEYKPDSALGYNCWAGEHLNFLSAANLDVKSGDIIEGKVTAVGSILGSWKINYEVLSINGETAGAEANKADYRSMTTEEVLMSGKWVAEKDRQGFYFSFTKIGNINFGGIYNGTDLLANFTWEVTRSTLVTLTPFGIDGDPVELMYAVSDNVPKLLDLVNIQFYVLEE